MILIPIGHEENTVRRLPWVNFAIIAMCVAAFAASGMGGPRPRSEQALREAFEPAVDYYLSHPYLEPDEQFMNVALPELEQGKGEILLEAMKSAGQRPPANSDALREEQDQLDRLVTRAMTALDAHPAMRWGLVPSRPSVASWITHMFMHAGWLHLLGNLLILYLAGPYIEDVWGRPAFAAFYVLGGVVAALAFAAVHPDSSIPMIGASGAISAVMGAFLVRYARTRIRFFYLVSFYLRGTFSAPAWVMLPLWLGQQLLLASLTSGSGDSGGVAYWAHVGGFVFGVAVAGGFRAADVEARWLAPAIDRKTTSSVVWNSAVERALDARSSGNADQAYRLLADHVAQHPADRDAALALWSVALETGRAPEAASALVRAIQRELRAGEADLAIAHWEELAAHAPQARVEPALRLRIAQAFAAQQRRDGAILALRQAVADAGHALSASLALQIARTAESLDDALARTALEHALSTPDLDPESRLEAERRLTALTPVEIGGSRPRV